MHRPVQYRISDIRRLKHQQIAGLRRFTVGGRSDALRQSKIQDDRGGEGLGAPILVQKGPPGGIVQQQKQEVLRNLWHEGTIAAELVT